MNCSICISINAMREDKMEALNTIIDEENNHELRQAQTLQVSLQWNTHKTEQPIESPHLTTDFSPQSPMSPLAACSPL